MAFSDYSSDLEPILDPSYGSLVFNHYYWGQINEDGQYLSGREEINSTHTCTKKELGIEYDPKETKFLPIRKNNEELIKVSYKKF